MKIKITAIVFLVCLIMLSACTADMKENAAELPYQFEPIGVSEDAPAKANQQELWQVVRDVNPSVVGISASFRTESEGVLDDRLTEGIGSGFIVSSDGYVLTNDHVAGKGASNIVVIMHDGRKLDGETLWSDSGLDLAMVKVNAVGLPVLSLGTSRNLMPGQSAIAIGTPLSLQFQHTVTKGIISAVNRTINVPTEAGSNLMEGLIQTDASINPGNSGGPLIYDSGRVIGINTVKVSTAEGIGFAIPIDLAAPIIAHFLDEGEFVMPYIGVIGFDKRMAGYFTNIDGMPEGVFVADLDRQGPAYSAGIRPEDIIVSMDGIPIKTMMDLKQIMFSHHPNDETDINIDRQGKSFNIKVKLGIRP